KTPIVFSRRGHDAMDRRAVAQVPQPHFADELKIAAPILVVAGRIEFVHAPGPLLDGRIAALNAGGEQKFNHAQPCTEWHSQPDACTCCPESSRTARD